MGTKRTMRRVPEDVAEAKYIHKLMTDDVQARVVQLATDGKHDEVAQIIGWKNAWAGIVADLDAAVTSTTTAIGATGSPIAKTAPAASQPVAAAASDLDEPEGGSRTNRAARTNRA